MTFTAIIPLRAGSKRIPWKNTRLLNWKPLFTYTLDNALKSKKINNIIITTDDLKVIEILNNDYKKELDLWILIILKRDEKLSSDKSTTVDVILDVIEKNNFIENIVLLQATSPFRNTKNIDWAIKLFKENDFNSVISIHKTKEFPYWQHKINSKWFLEPLMWLEFYNTRSQDLPKTYMENWAILISSKNSFIENNGFYTDFTKAFVLNEIEAIDIDEEIDFEYCEFLLTKNKIWAL